MLAEDTEDGYEIDRDAYGISGAEQFERLRDDVRAARREFASRSDDPAARDAFWIAEKTFQLFRLEHDVGGAFKFKKFAREIGEIARHGDLEARASRRRMLFVNMGELDRFNKEGGHDAGDAALRETVRAIERAARACANGVRYEIFRYAGNEYLVSFDDISEHDLAKVRRAIERERPSVPAVRDGAPLSVVQVNMSEAREAVRMQQQELGEAFDGTDLSRELVGAVRCLADWALEIKKFTARAERVASKLDDPDIEAFFANYIAKMFVETDLPSVEAFRAAVAEGPEAFRAAIERMAFEQAKRRIAGDRKFEGIVRNIVETRLEARQGDIAKLNETELAGPSLSSEAVPLASVPAMTSGQLAVERARQAYESAAVRGDGGASVELARLDLEIERARRDQGTGLLERGVYYADLETRLRRTEDASVVFVDMGFLKYFDQKGGRDVGDAALRTAAHAMQRALEEAGIRGEVYRYGGDEFTLLIDGGSEMARAAIRAIARARHDAGRIPSGPVSKPEYAPTKLVFNYGYADRTLVNAVWEDMVRAGAVSVDVIADPAKVANRQAELMTAAADMTLEGAKSVNRFMLLINELRNSSYADPVRRSQVDSLIDYSKKSIFSERGGAEMLREWADSGRPTIHLFAEVRRFVENAVAASRDHEGSVRSVRDRLIEAHVRIRHLEEELSRIRDSEAAHEQTISQLESRLRMAREEREKIINLRERLAA